MVEIKLPFFKRGEEVKVAVHSEKDRMIRLIIMIMAPFYAVWITFNVFYFMQCPAEWSIMVLVCGFFAWGAGLVIVWNQKQMEAGQYECFRQLKWRMSVTDRITSDVYVDGKIEYIGALGGYQVYKPHFPFAQFYQHPRLNNGEGITFNTAYWLLPDKWEQTFFPVPQQEAWFGSLPVTIKAEDVTLHNLRWISRKGEYIPVALVVDSNRHFEHTLGRIQLKEDEREPEIAKYTCEIAGLTVENIDLAVELVEVTETNKGLLSATVKQDDLVKKRMEDAKRRHSNISNIPPEKKWEKINWRIVVIAIVSLSLIALVASVILHYW